MAAKKDPLKEKEARQKKIAIVGGVLLLGLMAFQIPRTMKMLHSSDATTAAPTTSTAAAPGSTPLAPPSLDGSSAATASATGSSAGATSSDGVVDASSPLPASSGQLVSFSRFKTKDPFAQQVQECTNGCAATSTAGSAGGAQGGGATAGSGTATGTGAATGAVAVSGAVTGTGSSGSTRGSGISQKPTTASIFVNGVRSRVTVGQTFPSGRPVFALVAVTPKEAKISVSGGSIEGGAPTVTLSLGKTVRMQNTSDGSLYVLRLAGTA